MPTSVCVGDSHDRANLTDSICGVRFALHLGTGIPAAVEKAATRQERTIDAILRRLYHDDDERRREIVLLADEVGLGKTFVALGVAWSVLHRRCSGGPPRWSGACRHAPRPRPVQEVEARSRTVPATCGAVGHEVCSQDRLETPHDLARALRTRRPALVIARMSAFSGTSARTRYVARMAAIHSLLHMDDFRLSMGERLEMLSDWPSHATRDEPRPAPIFGTVVRRR